jgi:N-acetylneuraminic acid mutarotase
MRKAGALLVAIFLTASCLMATKPAFSSTEVTENTWVSKAPMHNARGYLGVAAVNGKIYAIGGDRGRLMSYVSNALGITHEVASTNEEYDVALDKWVVKSPMPTARARFGTSVYQNKIYCLGGYNSEYADLGVNEVYDPATDTWEARAPLPTPMVAPATNVVDGKIYVMSRDVIEVYDPATDTWAAKTSPPLEVRSYASAVVDNKIYVLGEELVDPVQYFLGYRVQVYDPANDNWTIRSSAPTVPFSSAVATTGLDALKRIYFFDETSNDVYDPLNDSWSVGARAPTKRAVASAVVVGELVYVVGGRTGEWGYATNMRPSAVNEQYTPFGYGAVPPVVQAVSPVSQTYNEPSVSLVFTVNKPVNWTGYSLDGGETVTVTGNTTIDGLANDVHNVTVYAKDTLGNVGASETIYFTVDVPFPAMFVVAPVASVVVVGAVLAIYFKKRKR